MGWVGNEGGLGGRREWSGRGLMGNCYGGCDEMYKRLEINGMWKDLGRGELMCKGWELFWYGWEVDVCMGGGWLYDGEEEKVVG